MTSARPAPSRPARSAARAAPTAHPSPRATPASRPAPARRPPPGSARRRVSSGSIAAKASAPRQAATAAQARAMHRARSWVGWRYRQVTLARYRSVQRMMALEPAQPAVIAAARQWHAACRLGREKGPRRFALFRDRRQAGAALAHELAGMRLAGLRRARTARRGAGGARRWRARARCAARRLLVCARSARADAARAGRRCDRRRRAARPRDRRGNVGAERRDARLHRRRGEAPARRDRAPAPALPGRPRAAEGRGSHQPSTHRHRHQWCAPRWRCGGAALARLCSPCRWRRPTPGGRASLPRSTTCVPGDAAGAPRRWRALRRFPRRSRTKRSSRCSAGRGGDDAVAALRSTSVTATPTAQCCAAVAPRTVRRSPELVTGLKRESRCSSVHGAGAGVTRCCLVTRARAQRRRAVCSPAACARAGV